MVKDDYPEIDDVHCDDDRFSEAMPFVLERAFEKSRDIHPSFRRSDREKDATGIYYFLRSEPVLRACLRNTEPGNVSTTLSERKPKRRKIRQIR